MAGKRRGVVGFALVLAGCSAREMPPGIGLLDVALARHDAIEGDGPGGDGPLSTGTTPYPDADLTLELPFGAAEQTADITVTAQSGRVDVHLLIDSTGSFGGEIMHLQSELVSTVIPGLTARIPSLTLGVSSFEDVPFAPFGQPTDYVWRLFLPQTSNGVAADAAVRMIALGNGGDGPEAWGEALYQIATGEGLRSGAATLVNAFRPNPALANYGTLGGVGFRTGSERVVVLVTDAPTHTPSDYGSTLPTAHSLALTEAALGSLGVRVVGIASSTVARPDLEAVATATGAVAPAVRGACSTGLSGTARAPIANQCPLVFDLLPDGTGLSSTIVTGIADLLDAVVYGDVHGESSDDDHGFVRAIEAVSATPPVGTPAPGRADDRPTSAPDGIDDTFTAVRASTSLSFRMHFDNRSVPSREWPQVFFLHAVVLADGQTLRSVLIRVIVPEGPKHDAGVDGA